MIDEIKQALESATYNWQYNGNEIVSSDKPRIGIGGFLTEEDNILAANAPRWLEYLISEVEAWKERFDRSHIRHTETLVQVEVLQKEFQKVNDDYKALINIMDRARKLAFLVDGGDNNERS